jgi:uncharacterized protein YbjT (DUF2867 family)
MNTAPRILLTGATGYVGGRLLRRLEARGLRVRCLARRPEFLRDRVAPTTEVVQGDLLDRGTLSAALAGVHTAYYLAHALGRAEDFEDAERIAAINFGAAARAAGVRRIIYLGGLADPHEELSPHLRTRLDTGTRLRESGVPVTEFRASIIIGSGSLSFEMIRALVERLPVMITPAWVRLPAQPIAIDDVLGYLESALDRQSADHEIFEIGGPDIVSYGDLMREYARQRGLRRWLISVPVLTPYLSSLWLGLVTPIFARIGRRLIESIRHPTVVRDRSASQAFGLPLTPVRDAIRRAIANDGRRGPDTHWSDALSSARGTTPWGGVRVGNQLVDSRSLQVDVSPADAFAPIGRIGGTTGWYYGQFLWRLRGWLDLMAGGVGMRRGRRDAESLRPGDVVDCWRVVECVEPSHLRLAAEMRLPGRAWLEFRVEPVGSGSSVTQTATFDPHGLPGLLYWYAVWPLHQLMFQGMLRNIARAAERPAHVTGGAAAWRPGL